MSLVKFIKQNKATMLAINTMLAEDFPTGTEHWWDVRISVLVDWFESNPLSIGIPSDGSLEMMRNEIERGNKYPKSRLKCWRHILLELNEIPEFEKHVQDELQLALECCGGKDDEKLDDLLTSERLKHMATTIKATSIEKKREEANVKEDISIGANCSSSACDKKDVSGESGKISATTLVDINTTQDRVETDSIKATTPIGRRNSLVSPKATCGRSLQQLIPISPKTSSTSPRSPRSPSRSPKNTDTEISSHKKNKKSATILAKAFLEHGIMENDDGSDSIMEKESSMKEEQLSPTKSIYSEKTLLARQERWLEAKQDKIQSQLKQKKEAEEKTLTFIPQTNHSRQRQRTNSNTSEKSTISNLQEPTQPIALSSFRDSSISGITQGSSDGGDPFLIPEDNINVEGDNNNEFPQSYALTTSSSYNNNNSNNSRRRSYADSRDQMKATTQTSMRRKSTQGTENYSMQENSSSTLTTATSSYRKRSTSNNASPTKQPYRRSSLYNNDNRDPSPTKKSAGRHRRNSSSLDSIASATSTDYKIATKGKFEKQKSRSFNDSDFSSFVEDQDNDCIQPVAPPQPEEDIQSKYAKTISKMNEGITLAPSPSSKINTASTVSTTHSTSAAHVTTNIATIRTEEDPQSHEGQRSLEESSKKQEEDDGMPDILPDAKVTVYKEGSFFSSIVNGRGYLKIRQGGEFQMRSMYRKKDKHHRQQGVSLLVGRLETPPHDEKVITVMFDTDLFTEEEAFEWWQLNSRRLAGAKPKLNKNDIVNNIKRKLQLAA